MNLNWHDVFYGNVIGNLGFSIGKSENLIFQKYCRLWPETNSDNEDMSIEGQCHLYMYFDTDFSHWPRASLNQILFCAYTRPKYQVSIYRTIGPLVSIFVLKAGFAFWLLQLSFIACCF